jgi:hypothetical protein
MAVRREDLGLEPDAVVYAFPMARVRRAAARELMLVRRRRALIATAPSGSSRPATRPRAWIPGPTWTPSSS